MLCGERIRPFAAGHPVTNPQLISIQLEYSMQWCVNQFWYIALDKAHVDFTGSFGCIDGVRAVSDQQSSAVNFTPIVDKG